jgi:hypothetical protein
VGLPEIAVVTSDIAGVGARLRSGLAGNATLVRWDALEETWRCMGLCEAGLLFEALEETRRSIGPPPGEKIDATSPPSVSLGITTRLRLDSLEEVFRSRADIGNEVLLIADAGVVSLSSLSGVIGDALCLYPNDGDCARRCATFATGAALLLLSVTEELRRGRLYAEDGLLLGT